MSQASEPIDGERRPKLRRLPLDVNLRPSNVNEALAVLIHVTQVLLQSRDPRSAFAAVYTIITRTVAEAVNERHDVFLEPEWISALSARFCARYVQTLSWSLTGDAPDCGAWRVYGSSPAFFPLEDVALGLSAHINFDLAQGIYETILSFGQENNQEMLARYKHDHDAVNALLEASLDESLEFLIHQGCFVSVFLRRWTGPVAGRLMLSVLARWRECVWEDAMALIDAPGCERRMAVVRRMDERSTRICRWLTVPGSIFRSCKIR